MEKRGGEERRGREAVTVGPVPSTAIKPRARIHAVVHLPFSAYTVQDRSQAVVPSTLGAPSHLRTVFTVPPESCSKSVFLVILDTSTFFISTNHYRHPLQFEI